MPYLQIMPKLEVTLKPKEWHTEEIDNFVLSGGTTITKAFLNTKGNIIIRRLSIATQGGTVIVTVKLPAPNKPEVKTTKATIPDVTFDYGEGILLANNETINIDFNSQSSNNQNIQVTLLWALQ